jgi:DNA-binding NtrC family response regulator
MLETRSGVSDDSNGGGFTLTEDQLAEAKIVVVDDDKLVTSSLSSFLSLELDVDPLTFNDSTKALSFLQDKSNEPDLIISDFLMPDLDGIQLLSAARQLHPEVPRVLLTGYADKENAIKAINDVQLFQHIEKPWENDRLRKVVEFALERVVLLRRLMDKLGAVKELMDYRRSLAR